MAPLTAEDLLAGSRLTYPVDIPANLLPEGSDQPSRQVVLRPLTVKDLQLIAKAANSDGRLSSSLIIQQALVEPALDHAQVLKLPAGLARFLVNKVNELSGLSTTEDALTEYVQTPMVRACFILAKEFGWTPEDVSGMTIGQILLYLQMIRSDHAVESTHEE